MNEKENAEIAFHVLERHYDQLLEEIKTKPDLDEIKALYQRIESSEIKMKELEIIENYQKRLSEMKGNLLNYLKPSKDLPSAPGATQKLGETEVIVEPEELPLTPEEIQRMGGTEVIVEKLSEELGASTVPEAETGSAPIPKEEGTQPILEKVENPGLDEIKKIIAYTETGVLDEKGQPRKTEKGDGLMDERGQFLIDFSRGIGAYLIGQKSRKDLPSNFGDLKEDEKKEAVANIVKEFLGMRKDENPDSDKFKLYKFIINSGQEMTTMFTDDMYHNIQYKGVQTSLHGTPQFEMKWGIDEKGECILELNLNIRVMSKGRGMDAEGLIACNQSGQVELYELGSEPKESPPLVRYHYKARLVPTEKGAKLETISYSVEINPGLSHSQKFTYPASNVFTEMQNVINAPYSVDSTERLKKAIADVKNSPAYKFVKDSGRGTKDQKKAVLMIDRLDKILNASEKSKVPIPASIIQKAIMFQVNQMKNSTEFNNGMVSLAKKAKESLESKEESMDTIILGKDDFRVGRGFIERVERLKKGDKIGAAPLKLNDAEFEKFYNDLKTDFGRLSTIQKGAGGYIDIQRSHWNKINENFNIASQHLSQLLTDSCFRCLADDGEKFSVIETGKNVLRKNIDLIKISSYYLEYQQQKREGKEKENPQHEMFAALDRCEKLLVKAIKTQKVPLVSMANNNKLKKFFQENSKKFEVQVQEAPSNRKSA